MGIRSVPRQVRAVAAGAASLVAVAAVGLAPWSAPAYAAAVGPVNPLAPAQAFNVMTEGNATLVTNETEGPVAVGGNLIIGGTYQAALVSAGSYLAPGDALPTGLLVNGAVNWTASVAGAILRVVQPGGFVKIGNPAGTFVRATDNNNVPANTRVLPADDYNATPRIEVNVQQSVTSVTTPAGLDFAAAYAAFRQSSTALATCPNTVVLTDDAGAPLPRPLPTGMDAVVHLQPNATNVLNLTADEYNGIGSLIFATPPTASSPLLINIETPPTFVMTPPNFAGVTATDASFILVNIPTATVLDESVGAATVAGILAPNASYTDTNPSNVEGQVIARAYAHGLTTRVGIRDGEVHYHVFSALLACETLLPTASSAAASGTATSVPATPGSATPSLPITTGSSPGGDGSLPRTGRRTGRLLAEAGGLVLVGLGLVLLARRGRDHAGRHSD
jgi:choice-of-anchor A domain-containing protein